jgi:stress-induced morphogen
MALPGSKEARRFYQAAQQRRRGCEMAKRLNKASDSVVSRIEDALKKYGVQHTRAAINVYRQNSAAIRIRIIDPDFSGLDLVERDTRLWRILDELPEEVLNEITLLLLLTPEEVGSSFANHEFENPLPSRL